MSRRWCTDVKLNDNVSIESWGDGDFGIQVDPEGVITYLSRHEVKLLGALIAEHLRRNPV